VPPGLGINIPSAKCMDHLRKSLETGSLVAAGKGSRSKLVRIYPAAEAVEKPAGASVAAAGVKAQQAKLVAKALQLLEGGKTTEAQALLEAGLAQASLFCSTVATQDGSPERGDKATAVKVHVAVGAAADDAVARHLAADEPTATTPAVAVDALQWLIQLGTGTMTAGQVADRTADRLRTLLADASPSSPRIVGWVYDKPQLVPAAKAIEQARRTGVSASYADAIVERSLLERQLQPDTEVKLGTYLGNRALRAALVRFIVAQLRDVVLPAGATVVIDSEDGICILGDPLPDGVEERLRAVSLGEADAALWAFVSAFGVPATVCSTDADAFCWGMLTAMAHADPHTGALPNSWYIVFAPNRDARRRFNVSSVFRAIAHGQVCPLRTVNACGEGSSSLMLHAPAWPTLHHRVSNGTMRCCRHFCRAGPGRNGSPRT